MLSTKSFVFIPSFSTLKFVPVPVQVVFRTSDFVIPNMLAEKVVARGGRMQVAYVPEDFETSNLQVFPHTDIELAELPKRAPAIPLPDTV